MKNNTIKDGIVNEATEKEASSENTENTVDKKKMGGYETVRKIMMIIFGALFLVFLAITVAFMIRNHNAKKANDDIMGGFNQITNPGTLPSDDDPVIVMPGDDTSGLTPGETQSPEDEAYSKYVAECIAEAKKLKEEYSDFRAIIVIEGDTVNLKYPVFQSTDNQYYVEYLVDGSKNTAGEIFIDCRNSGEILNNRNTVIYGHNMNNGTKFGQLHKYKHNNAFYTHNVTIITAEAVLIFKPFSFYKTDIYNPYTRMKFENDADFAEFCRSEQERSMFESNIEFTGKERIITLSTCYGTSKTERYCLHAVLVNISK